MNIFSLVYLFDVFSLTGSTVHQKSLPNLKKSAKNVTFPIGYFVFFVGSKW